MSKPKYIYTNLAKLKAGGPYAIYGVIEHLCCSVNNDGALEFSFCLLDETLRNENRRILCELKIPFNLMKGRIMDGAVIRIHRIYGKTIDGVVRLNGTAGVAGLHAVCFNPVVSFPDTPCLLTSEKYTFDDVDKKRVDELRKLSALNNPRNLSFISTVLRDVIVVSNSPPSTTSTSAEHIAAEASTSRESPQQQFATHKPFSKLENSFDYADFVTESRNSKAPVIELDSEEQPSAPKNTEDDADRLHKAIINLRKLNSLENCTDFKSVCVGRFFNLTCQVIGVLCENQRPGAAQRAYLRVTDGTAVRSNKPTYRVPVGNLDQTRCKIDNTLDEKFNSISVDVTCFDEYIAKAIACEPGDFVEIRNVRVNELNSYISFNMHGNSSGFGFNRRIKIISRWTRPPLTSTPKNHPQSDENINNVENVEFADLLHQTGSPITKRSRY